ncbi:MAG: ABC transporter permease, partial [Nocardioidaceae bacterium]
MTADTTAPTKRPATRQDGSLSVVEGIVRQYDYWATVYQRTWRGGVVSSFATPLFYVVAMGVLLGGFVDVDPDRLEGATSYLAFVVPGLVAAHAMTLAVSETTYPVMGAIKWHRTFYAQLATPLAVRDLVNAFLCFVMFRVASACAVFMLVLAPFGVFESWWGPVLAWLAQVLVGTAFALLTFGYSARLKSEEGFGVLFRLGVLPLTLFS